MKEQKISLNIIDVVIDLVSYALKMGVSGCHMCVCNFVSQFRS